MNFICKATHLFGLSCPEDINTLKANFSEHVSTYGLHFATAEEFEFRFEIFMKKEQEIAAINADPKNTFTAGHNQFSTWTDAEFDKLLGSKKTFNTSKLAAQVEDDEEVPRAASVDWRTKGAVNPV